MKHEEILTHILYIGSERVLGTSRQIESCSTENCGKKGHLATEVPKPGSAIATVCGHFGSGGNSGCEGPACSEGFRAEGLSAGTTARLHHGKRGWMLYTQIHTLIRICQTIEGYDLIFALQPHGRGQSSLVHRAVAPVALLGKYPG